MSQVLPEREWVTYMKDRANGYARGGEFFRAVACLEQIMEWNTSLPETEQQEVYLQLASGLSHLERNKEALNCYEQVLKLGPVQSTGDIYMQMAILYYRMQMQEMSVAYFDKAIAESDMEYPGDAYYYKAAALRELHQYGEALECYNKAESLKHSVGNWEIDNSRGFVHLWKENWGEAIELFQKVAQCKWCDLKGNTYNNLGATYQSKGDLAQAERYFKLAAEDRQYDTSGYAWDRLGLIYQDRGDYAEAFRCYHQAERKYGQAKLTGVLSAEVADGKLKDLADRLAILRKGQIIECFKSDKGRCSYTLEDRVKGSVFVVMPFGSNDMEKAYYDRIYNEGILPAVSEDCGLPCQRADRKPSTGDIMCKICLSIQQADIVIGDLSGAKPNVCYEIGLAHALQRKVVLITRSLDDMPFDLQALNCMPYSDERALRQDLATRLSSLIE